MVWFWEGNRGWSLLLEKAILWIMDSYFSQKQQFENQKHPDDRFIFFTNMKLSLHQMLTDCLQWCGLLVDYCDVFISCLDSHYDGTHSLQIIFWWASDGMLHFSNISLQCSLVHDFHLLSLCLSVNKRVARQHAPAVVLVLVVNGGSRASIVPDNSPLPLNQESETLFSSGRRRRAYEGHSTYGNE